jgi:hypothetical protein
METLGKKAKEPAAPAATCPAPEILAAYFAGETDPTTRDPIEAHLAACPACRAAVSDAVEDVNTAPARQAVPERILARARSTIRAAFLHARGTVNGRSPRPALASPAARQIPRWSVIPLSAAAGLLGGVIGAGWWVRPVVPPASPTPPISLQAPGSNVALAQRLEALETRAATLESRATEQAKADERAIVQAQALSAALEALKRDVSNLGATVRGPALPETPSSPPPQDLADRLVRFHDDIFKLQTDVLALRRSNEETAKALADACAAEARSAEELRLLRDRIGGLTLAQSPSPIEIKDALAAVRQGVAEDFQRAMESLRGRGLEVLGQTVAYYCKDAPRDRRTQAGEELNRRGPKGVDHDLILALAHDQLLVRQESAFHLVRYRTRGHDFGYNPTGLVDDRQKAIMKVVRWWENEYKDDFPEKILLQRDSIIFVPPNGATKPPMTPPGTSKTPPVSSPPAPIPPQYNPPPPGK